MYNLLILNRFKKTSSVDSRKVFFYLLILSKLYIIATRLKNLLSLGKTFDYGR